MPSRGSNLREPSEEELAAMSASLRSYYKNRTKRIDNQLEYYYAKHDTYKVIQRKYYRSKNNVLPQHYKVEDK
jgi:hypothetical protein